MVTDASTGSSSGRPTDGSAGYPIGYWLKRLDGAIEGALASALAAEGLARRHWQIMNLLHEGSSDGPGLAEALAPFWRQEALTPDEVLSDLEHRALVVNDGRFYTLTTDGEVARGKIAEIVGVTRRRLIDGIAQDEYLATVRVLQRMTANLEGAPADR